MTLLLIFLVRAFAKTLRTPTYATRVSRHNTTTRRCASLKIIAKHVKMEDSILSSLAVREHKPGEEWKTPERSRIRGMRKDGKSYGEIKLTGLERSTIQRICKAKS